MVFVLPHTFTLFCLPAFWLWAYLRNMHYELLVFVLCLVYPRSHRGRDKPNQPILCIQYCLCPRSVHSWLPFRFSLTFIFDLCLVYPVLPVSLECPFLIAPSAFSNVYLRPVSTHLIFSGVRVTRLLELNISVGLWALAVHQSVKTQMLLSTCFSFMINMLLSPLTRPLTILFLCVNHIT